jgi:hypothetical protein
VTRQARAREFRRVNPAETAPSRDDATMNIASDDFTKKTRGNRVEIAVASPRSGVIAVCAPPSFVSS